MYKEDFIEAFKDGLLLLAKYGVLIAAVIYLFNYSMNTRQMAMNGEQAAVAIKIMQEKGYLPQFDRNGNLPEKK
jgi:hypothetical protein